MTLTKALDIIYFSTRSIDEPIWTSTQYVGTKLAVKNRVLFVNPPITPFMLIKHPSKIKDAMKLRKKDDKLYIFTPFQFLPYVCLHEDIIWINNISQIFILRILKRILKRLNFRKPQLWIISPTKNYYLDKLNEELIVYKCDGELSTYPLHHYPIIYSFREKLRQWSLKQEQKLLEKADIVFCTSKSIFKRKKQINSNTHQVRLGISVENFMDALSDKGGLPHDISQIKHPVIGFVGALDKYKVDFGLITYAAQSHPDFSFVLIGQIGVVDDTKHEDLPKLNNIYYLGAKKSKDIPKYLKAFDVCIMPYVLNEYTINLTTMKFFEYMATGKPIVISALPQLKEYEGMVKVAETKREFVESIEQCLEDNDEKLANKRIELAKKYSWDNQVEKMLGLIMQTTSYKEG